MLETRQATARDVQEWFDGEPPATMRAWAAVLDGKVVGLAGVAYAGLTKDRPRPEAFSMFRPELEPYLQTPAIRRLIRRVVKMIRSTRPAPIAVADPKFPGAPDLLKKLGAVHIGSCELGEVYQWN